VDFTLKYAGFPSDNIQYCLREIHKIAWTQDKIYILRWGIPVFSCAEHIVLMDVTLNLKNIIHEENTNSYKIYQENSQA
jgi:hypothetical protein